MYTRDLGAISFEDVMSTASGAKVAFEKAKQYAGKAGSILDSAKVILEDPALPEITGYILELNRLEQKAPKKGGAPSKTKGVGLKRVIVPLKYYVAYRKNPIVGYIAIAAILGLPFMLGYLLGK